MLSRAQRWMIVATLCTILVCSRLVESAIESDRITSLQGQPKVSFQQFAGYISVDEHNQRYLFYYFVEAETEPASKPIVLWLNGGPGCSSVGVGAFAEHGPFMPKGNGLVQNDYSWNKEANMLYLESPAGVGFSYSTNKSFYNSVNDDITALDNLVFLKQWFKSFPEYQNNDFFIAGESYAGHYVPQLADRVLRSKSKFNLKGIAIGNGLLEFNTNFNSMGEYTWSHGLISDATMDLLNTACNYSQIRRQITVGKLTPICSLVANQYFAEMSNSIDIYDVTLDKCLNQTWSQSEVLHQSKQKREVDVCLIQKAYEFLNRKDVQMALHALLIGETEWRVCSRVMNYDLQNLEIPTTQLIGSLVKSGVRVLAYSGDQDSVLPLTGSRTLVNGIAKDFGLNTTSPYRPWFQEKQVGGWTQEYGNMLTFATIRGASHQAPATQPERSLLLFKQFLKGKPLPSINEKERARKQMIKHFQQKL